MVFGELIISIIYIEIFINAGKKILVDIHRNVNDERYIS